MHNVLFASGFRDRINLQGRRRGRPTPTWLQVIPYRHYQAVTNHTAPQVFFSNIARHHPDGDSFVELAPMRKRAREAIAKNVLLPDVSCGHCSPMEGTAQTWHSFLYTFSTTSLPWQVNGRQIRLCTHGAASTASLSCFLVPSSTSRLFRFKTAATSGYELPCATTNSRVCEDGDSTSFVKC